MATIELTDINGELTRLWDESQGQKKIRASLFTLIAYVQKGEREEHFEKIIKSVVSKFPCRVLMIVHDEKSASPILRTSVSAQTIGEGSLQIYCELIRIEVAGALAERVPYIVTPHLLPDLPVYLLWTQDPAQDNQILPHLEPLADRIIFDSESTHDLKQYARTVKDLASCFHCAIGDLNWSAISGWRQIFRQVFDTFETFIDLVESNVIKIHYNQTEPHTELEAAYMQAWIASRLNWKFQKIAIEEGNIRLTYKRPTAEVAILLIPEKVLSLPPATLLEVEIECEKNKGHYMFKRHPESRQVFIQYSDKDHCHLPVCTNLSGSTEGQEIIEEIFYPSTGDHYKQMLDILTNTPWKR